MTTCDICLTYINKPDKCKECTKYKQIKEQMYNNSFVVGLRCSYCKKEEQSHQDLFDYKKGILTHFCSATCRHKHIEQNIFWNRVKQSTAILVLRNNKWVKEE